MTTTGLSQIAKYMSEAELLANVKELARHLGYRTYHTHDSRRSDPGFPDLVLACPKRGRLIFAELKTETGRVRPEQAAWIDDLTALDHDVYLWRPSDWLSGAIRRALTTTLEN